MPSKQERINSAYSQMRISGLTVSPSPEDNELALDRLENMMSELEFSRNICMDYNFEEAPDPNSETGVVRSYWHMMDTNLAVRLIPDFNKVVPQTLILQASQALATASSQSAAQSIRQIANPNRMPIGSGTTLRYNKYQRFNREQRIPPPNCETNVMIIDDVDDYRESYIAYLGDESIASFTIEADRGLTLVSSSNDTPIINYRIKAVDNTVTSGTWQQVKIIVTTSSGRVDTRLINFEIQPNLTVNNN